MADPAKDLFKNSELAASQQALTSLKNQHEVQARIAKIRSGYDHHPPEESSEGNWLVSYADMMTLLVGFFVLLLSFSKLDATQFEKIKKETTKVFGGEYKMPFEDLGKNLKKVIDKSKLSNQVYVKETDEGIEITFRGALFFESGSTILKEEAKNLMSQLIPEISSNAKDFGITVEGHTDNKPLSGGAFPSNWELSSVRACTVLRMFQEQGFDPHKLKAIGWGEQKPIFPNADEAGNPIPQNQAQNRRVVIKIIRDF